MSHVVNIPVKVLNLNALRAACKTLGYEFMEGKTSYQWYGHWVDDSPVPEGLFSPEETARIRTLTREARCAIMNERLGRCAHAIRVPGASYEIGVVPRYDGRGYTLMFDWYYSGGLSRKLTEAVQQNYSVEVLKNEARLRGHTVLGHTLKDGVVKLSILAGR